MPVDGFDWVDEVLDVSTAVHGDAEFYRRVAAELTSRTDRLATDFGCGGAGMAVALHEAYRTFGSRTPVVGLDANPEAYASAQQEHPELSFVTASFEDSPAAIRRACGGAPDVMWTRGALHHAGDVQQGLRALTETLAPGGVLALNEDGATMACLPRRLGAGAPGLHFRLHSACAVDEHDAMPDEWLTAMRRAGLQHVRIRHVLFDEPAPLGGADLDYVLDLLTEQVRRAQSRLSDSDVAAWRQLLDSEDPAWLGLRGDLFYMTAARVHIGHKTDRQE